MYALPYLDNDGYSINKDVIKGIVLQTKTNIDKALNKEDVDVHLANGKTLLDAVKSDNQELEIYKEKAKTSLDTYVNKNDYTINLDSLLKVIKEGKVIIQSSDNFDAVDYSVSTTKSKIDEILSDQQINQEVSNPETSLSSNNNLKSISLSSGILYFNKNTLNYTVVVKNDVTSITIRASAEDSKSIVTGVGS